MGLIRKCLEMIPRLQAEEALQAVSVTALGTGSMQASDAREAKARLARAATGGRREKPRAATPDDLVAMGIGVRVVGQDGH